LGSNEKRCLFLLSWILVDTSRLPPLAIWEYSDNELDIISEGYKVRGRKKRLLNPDCVVRRTPDHPRGSPRRTRPEQQVSAKQHRKEHPGWW